MSTVDASQSLTLSLPAGRVLNVATPAEASAVVVRLSDVPGGGDAQTITLMAASASADFGPFATTTRHVLQAIGAALSYSTALSVASGGGGGAAAFTDLSDAPAAIVPTGVVVGNAAGTALEMSDIISINENGVTEITVTDAAGLVITSNTANGITIVGAGNGGVNLASNDGLGGITLQANSPDENANGVSLMSDGAAPVFIRGNGPQGVVIRASGAEEVESPLDVYVDKVVINNEEAVASQSIVIAGVGTLVFTHGILTSFTPEA